MTLSAATADHRLRDLILELSARLASLLEEDIDDGIEEVLGDLGRSTAVDRAYVMTFGGNGSTLSNDHEWVAPGVAPAKAEVQDVPLRRVGAWLPAFARGEAVQVSRLADLDASDETVAAFEAQSIRSMLWVPMPGPVGPLGFVGFDSVHSERTWDDDEVALLRSVGNLIAAALERRSAALERDLMAKRLTALAALVPGAVYQFQVHADGRLAFPYVSPGVQALFGIRPEALRDEPETAFAFVHPDDLSGLQASIERSRATLREWAHEFRTTPDRPGAPSRLRWIRGLANPERMTDGSTLWHGIVTDVTESRAMAAALRRDVTERQEAQVRLEREVAFRSALVSVTNDMLGSALDDGFYQEVLGRTIELVPDAEAGSVLLRDDDGRYRFVASVEFDLDALRVIRLKPAELARSHPPAVERVFVRESHPVLDDHHREAFVRAGRLGDIRVTLSVPIVVAGEVRGYMNLDNFQREEAFDVGAQAIAEALAAQVAVALQRLQLERDLDEERARYERLASHDPLTNLPNRRLLQDRLEQALTRARRRSERVALLYLDLDTFKGVNDTLGHDVGDELLEAVAERLVQVVRAEDTVARLGGDEFAVVLQQVATDRDAEQVAEKLLDAFEAPFALSGLRLVCRASIGIAVFPRDARSGDALMKAADVAMYRVKASGRGAFAFHSAEAGTGALDGS